MDFMTPIAALLHPAKPLELASNMAYLFRTYAPPGVMRSYVSGLLRRGEMRRFRAAQAEFKACIAPLSFSNEWFIGNIPFWLSTFERYQLDRKPDATALEIGSWEGLSTFFLLHTLSNISVTCVDTWQGADEHRGQQVLERIESSFDANLSRYKDRLTKYKGTSFSYFNAHGSRFDLVYVDGSHHCDDVMVDALMGFQRLKPGGILILDDYLWRRYPRANDNPAAAINAFLRLKQGCYRIVRVHGQIIIEKTAPDARGARA
jgi:predicted O-methyltransferase YrrM